MPVQFATQFTTSEIQHVLPRRSPVNGGVCLWWSVAVCCSVQCVAVCCSVLQCAAVCCSVLQCAAECCSVLCVAVCRSILQFTTHLTTTRVRRLLPQRSPVNGGSVLQHVAVCCSVLHYVATCCNVLQRVALCCSRLQCVTVRCSMLQCVYNDRICFRGNPL